MAESTEVEQPKAGKKPRRVGYLKMKVIDDLRKEMINKLVQSFVNPSLPRLYLEDF